jgi:hypothetical protein
VFIAKALTVYAVGDFLPVNGDIIWRVDSKTHFIASDLENFDRDSKRWKTNLLPVVA